MSFVKYDTGIIGHDPVLVKKRSKELRIMSNQNERADELFETLSKNKKKRRRKVFRTVMIAILVIAVILVAVVSGLRRSVEERFASISAEVLTYQVQSGTIHTVVSGSGTLAEVDLEKLTVPAGVEIMELTVESGTLVNTGDVLATVDLSSVMSAMAALQTELDELDEQIAEAKGDEVDDEIEAGIAGRVKIVYAEEDTDVGSCMAQHGALAVLSLDLHMAVDIDAGSLVTDDPVTVIRANGSEIPGIVGTVSRGTATILMTDNGPEYGEEVTVCTKDGDTLGSGSLYIHAPLAVTAYAGTIDTVEINENERVSEGDTLFTLRDTSFSANYDTLLREREALEEELLKLLTIYRDGAVLSPMDGMVSSVEYSEDPGAETAAFYTVTETDGATDLLTLYPNVSMSITIGIDETDILALELGQEAEVVVSSISEDVLTGTVTEISREASTLTGITQYSAVVTVEKTEGMLTGMTADVDVKIKGVENALIIPVDALHQTSTISYVYTSYDEETGLYGGMVEVVTGMQNDSFVEILSGLNAGDTVYYTESENFFWGFGNMSGFGNRFSGTSENGQTSGFSGMDGTSGRGFGGMGG